MRITESKPSSADYTQPMKDSSSVPNTAPEQNIAVIYTMGSQSAQVTYDSHITGLSAYTANTYSTSAGTNFLKTLGPDACRSIQKKLKYLGYYHGDINGSTTTENMKNAVKAFQKKYGITQSGYVDKTTYDKIVKRYDTRIQEDLKQLGFYSGTADGDPSSTLSRKALQNFQRVYGLRESGGLDTSSSNMIERVSAEYIKIASSPGVSAITCMMNGFKDYVESEVRDNFAKIWTFLKLSMGLGTMHTAAVAGNMKAESGFSPANAQDTDTCRQLKDNIETFSQKGRGYGIIQWTFADRKTALSNTAIKMGLQVSDINAQLAYFKYEMETGICKSEWEKFKSSKSLSNASDIFLNEIEMPDAKNFEERRGFCRTIYNVMNKIS